MCKNYCSLVFLAITVAVIGFAANVQADTVLFTDNFDAANNATASYGLNDNLVARQAGSSLLATNPTGLSWGLHTPGTFTQAADTVQVNNATLGTNTMAIYTAADKGTNTGSWPCNYMDAIIQHDFAPDLTGKAFTVRWDTDPLAAGTPTTQSRVAGTYAFIGCSTPGGGEGNYASLGPYDTSNDICVFVCDTGHAYIEQGTKAIYSADSIFDTLAGTSGSSIAKPYTFELRVSTFAPGAAATATLWWGAQGTASSALTEVNFTTNKLDTNGSPSLPFTWDSNAVNYIGFGGTAATTAAVSMLDNVSVSTVGTTPEPSTLVLLGMGLAGLLAYAWRKRR